MFHRESLASKWVSGWVSSDESVLDVGVSTRVCRVPRCFACTMSDGRRLLIKIDCDLCLSLLIQIRINGCA
jgi:hypothetical protein